MEEQKEQNRGIRVGKIHRKMEDSDLNEINSRTSYKKYYPDKSISKSQQGSEEIINDNLSEKANSIHTSYKYQKKSNGNNSISSGCSCNHKNENNQYNDDESVSISENDNKSKKEMIKIKKIIIQMVIFKNTIKIKKKI